MDDERGMVRNTFEKKSMKKIEEKNADMLTEGERGGLGRAGVKMTTLGERKKSSST